MIKLMIDKERDFNLSSMAVEQIEDHYNKTFEEIFKEATELRARDVNCILYAAMVEQDITLDEFKVELAKRYTYPETVKLMNSLLGVADDPNATNATENV
jgi:hypothetical protein